MVIGRRNPIRRSRGRCDLEQHQGRYDPRFRVERKDLPRNSLVAGTTQTEQHGRYDLPCSTEESASVKKIEVSTT